MKINPINNNYNIISFKARSYKSQNNPLTKKYGIDTKTVQVVSSKPVNISDEEKDMLIEKILEAHELAQKNYNWGNIAKAGYATNIGLTNGMWHSATNFNNTRNEISAICGERNAILGAYNDILRTKSIENPQQKPLDFHIKYIAMSSYKPIGTDKNASASCSDCLSWFNTTRYFDDDTLIAVLEKNQQTSNLELKLINLNEYLPYRNEINTASSVEIERLQIKTTSAAAQAIKEKGLSEEEIRELIQETRKKYTSNNLAEVSGHNISSGIIANGEKFFGQKIDYSKRWYTEPLHYAAAKAIEKFGNDTQIDAICYVGDSIITDKYGINHNDGVVNIKTLGMLRTKFANPDTIVITNTKDSIQIRTIDDYTPDRFKFTQNYAIRTENTEKQTFDKGIIDGIKDGMEGRISSYKKSFDTEKDSDKEYEEGYNKGYRQGKEKSGRNYASMGDVIQDWINEGIPRNKAIEYTSNMFGGM